ERLLSLDPENYSALWHLTEIAAIEKNATRLDSLAKRMRQTSVAAQSLRQVDVITVCASGNAPGLNRVLDTLRGIEDLLIEDLLTRCATTGRNLPFAERMA